MTDDWRSVDEALYWLDQHLSWRPVVAALRRLIAAIKADRRFHALAPSMSHDALVLRRSSDPGVWIIWKPEDDTYQVTLIDSGSTIRERRCAASPDACVELLSEYLDRSPLPPAHPDKSRPTTWDVVDAEYREIADHYPSEAAFAARMQDLVVEVRVDVRFRDVDARVARGTSRAGAPISSLVLNLLAQRSVWCWWDTDEALYHVALVEGDLMLQDARGTNIAETVDLMAGDLEQAAP